MRNCESPAKSSQSPISQLQGSTKLQAQNRPARRLPSASDFEVCCLRFGTSLELGAWWLVFRSEATQQLRCGPASDQARVRDERVTTLWRNQRGIGFTDAWLYPIGYTSRIPSRRDWTTIAQHFSVGSRARISQVPKGRLKFIPINNARKPCRSFSRPFGTQATRDSPPNVETLGYSRQSLRDRGNPTASKVVKPSAWLLFCPARPKRPDGG